MTDITNDSSFEMDFQQGNDGLCNTVSSDDSTSSSFSKLQKFQLEARFECPICLLCLKSPYITSCGHKFCKDCIYQWLRKEGSTCPIDSQKLSLDSDIFPDNYTKREISQQIVTCPFPDCSQALPLIEAEKHMFEQHKDDEMSSTDKKCCPFYKFGCQFEFSTQSQLISHLQTYMSHHLLLMSQGFTKLDSDVKMLAKKEEANLWDAPSKSSNNYSPQVLLNTLYSKVVFLEQTDQEKSIDINCIKTQMTKFNEACQLDNQRRSGGVLMWKIEKVSQTLRNMALDHTVKLFSQPFYTSYYGYKFCCRLNINASDPNFLSMNVHLMKGENDYSLNWPFSGKIQLVLIHPSIPERTLREVMISNPELEAFKRPRNDISLRGFGYADFVRFNDLLDLGYIDKDDALNIRVDITLV